MLLLPHGPSAPHFHRCKLQPQDDRSIRRTTRAPAPEHGHVGATVRRQEFDLARASGLQHAVAPPHTRNYVDPACTHVLIVSKRTMTNDRGQMPAEECMMRVRLRTCTSRYPPRCTRRQRRTCQSARARRVCARTRRDLRSREPRA
jgi:hypothetical protein